MFSPHSYLNWITEPSEHFSISKAKGTTDIKEELKLTTVITKQMGER